MKNLLSQDAGKAKVFLVLVFLLTHGFLHAQSASWTLQSEKDGVKLYSSTTQCGDKNMLVFKFENTNSTPKNINYSVVVKSPGHNIPLRPQSLKLDGSETKVGSCDTGKELTADIKEITSFELMITLVVN